MIRTRDYLNKTDFKRVAKSMEKKNELRRIVEDFDENQYLETGFQFSLLINPELQENPQRALKES